VILEGSNLLGELNVLEDDCLVIVDKRESFAIPFVILLFEDVLELFEKVLWGFCGELEFLNVLRVGVFELFECFDEDKLSFLAFFDLVLTLIDVEFKFFDLIVEDSMLVFVLSLDFENVSLEGLEFESEGVVMSEDLFELGFGIGVQFRWVGWIRVRRH
jgi:hypothetical protein